MNFVGYLPEGACRVKNFLRRLSLSVILVYQVYAGIYICGQRMTAKIALISTQKIFIRIQYSKKLKCDA